MRLNNSYMTALIFIFAIIGFILPISAKAQSSRFALAIGSNRGNNPTKTLRFAERDATRFSDVLVRIGGFSANNVNLLLHPNLAEVKNAIKALKNRLETNKQEADAKSLVLIYFSGHADGIELELGNERLAFVELRNALELLGADVKIMIMDSCRSGGALAYKGGRPGPAFDIVFSDTIDANGTAVLTSSSAGEKSQESGRLMGSFFTHFLISGLSGTADFDQDQRVTLNEVYQYAYSKTVAETSRTIGGIQHPTYDFQITGRGNVVLTDLNLGSASIYFGPETSGNYVILRASTNEVVAEVTKSAKTKRQTALSPDTYRIAVEKNKTVYSTIINLREGEQLRLMESDLKPDTKLEKIFGKGEDSLRKEFAASAYYAMLSGTLKRYTALHQAVISMRFDVRRFTLFPRFTIGATRINEEGFSYQLLLITGEGAAALRFERGPVDLFLGINCGGGYGRQLLASELRKGSMFIYGLLTGLDFLFARRGVLSIFWEAGSHVYRAQDKITQSLLLRGSIGTGIRF